ncbi:MAG: hypothetical protein NTV25_04640 [Methanothrix sp.]|nr:hypothetical protein [Methanothrix sp.]
MNLWKGFQPARALPAVRPREEQPPALPRRPSEAAQARAGEGPDRAGGPRMAASDASPDGPDHGRRARAQPGPANATRSLGCLGEADSNHTDRKAGDLKESLRKVFVRSCVRSSQFIGRSVKKNGWNHEKGGANEFQCS